MEQKQKNRIRITVLYRGRLYDAKDISIDKAGNIYINYLHGIDGAIDQEHITEIYLNRRI